MKPQPLIILEGPDGAGKTTLAGQIQAVYPELTYHHEGPPPRESDPFCHYFTVLTEAQEKPTILDRFAPGELVYGPVYRGMDLLGENGWSKLHDLVQATSPANGLILCLPSYEVCHRAWSSGREELFTDQAVFLRTYQAYHDFLSREKKLNHNWYVYDFTERDAFEKLIKDYIAPVMRKANIL